MKKKIGIVDINFMTYIYHSTPQASMYTMLISGWHKSQGDIVVFLDDFPTPTQYDVLYLVKDRRGLLHLNRWLGYDNVKPVGNYWDKEGIKSYYNPEWETTPPDNTIYWNWLQNWKDRYPKYNPERLAHFYMEPIKVRQKGKEFWPQGTHFLILDNDMEVWDPDFLKMLDQDIKHSRLAYPIPVDGRWEQVLKFISFKQLERSCLFLEMDYVNYPKDEDYIKAAEMWAKYKLGRMIRIYLFAQCSNDEEWTAAIPRLYDILGKFRMIGTKKLRFYPIGMDNFSHPRILQEMKRWTGASMGGYLKNSLFDYILFDSVRGTSNLLDFLTDPYLYVKKKRFGSNKLEEVIQFIEDRPELFFVITESYPKGAY